MTDVTAPLMELRAAYRAMQSFERDKKEELKNKYREQMEDELKGLVAAEKYAFSKRLKAVKEQYGLRVNDIQDHVLRTRNWRIWENLRDAAGIEPEQVILENSKKAREMANRPYRWIEGAVPFAFDVVKDLKGNSITPIRIEVESATSRNYAGKEQFWPKDYSRDLDFSGFGGYADFDRAVVAEIKRAFEAGEIPEVIEPYDASQRAKKNAN